MHMCIGYARVPVQVRNPSMKSSGEGKWGLFWFYTGTFIDFILPVARRFYSACRQTILFTCTDGMGIYYEPGCCNLRRTLVHEYHSRIFDHFSCYAQNFHPQ